MYMVTFVSVQLRSLPSLELYTYETSLIPHIEQIGLKIVLKITDLEGQIRLFGQQDSSVINEI